MIKQKSYPFPFLQPMEIQSFLLHMLFLLQFLQFPPKSCFLANIDEVLPKLHKFFVMVLKSKVKT